MDEGSWELWKGCIASTGLSMQVRPTGNQRARAPSSWVVKGSGGWTSPNMFLVESWQQVP